MTKYDLIIACEELKNKLTHAELKDNNDANITMEMEACYTEMQDLIASLNTI